MAKTVYRRVREPEPRPYPVKLSDYYSLTLIGHTGLLGKAVSRKSLSTESQHIAKSSMKYKGTIKKFPNVQRLETLHSVFIVLERHRNMLFSKMRTVNQNIGIYRIKKSGNSGQKQ